MNQTAQPLSVGLFLLGLLSAIALYRLWPAPPRPAARGEFPFVRQDSRIQYISQWYHDPGSPERQAELMTSICTNLRNPHIDRMHFLQPTDTSAWYQPFLHLSIHCNITRSQYLAKVRFYRGWVTDRLERHRWLERLTTKSAFVFANRHFPGSTVLLANLDIEFDETLCLLSNDPHLACSHAYFLSRYERDEEASLIGTQCGPKYMGSHDSIVFVPPLPEKLVSRCDLRLGHVGAEGRLIYEFELFGIRVSNPCLDIRSWHRHSSHVRRWITPEANLDGKSSIAPPSSLPYNHHKC